MGCSEQKVMLRANAADVDQLGYTRRICECSFVEVEPTSTYRLSVPMLYRWAIGDSLEPGRTAETDIVWIVYSRNYSDGDDEMWNANPDKWKKKRIFSHMNGNTRKNPGGLGESEWYSVTTRKNSSAQDFPTGDSWELGCSQRQIKISESSGVALCVQFRRQVSATRYKWTN